MARARNIKPGFYKNEDLAECSIWARYIFPGLWMLADREGRLEDRPKRIKAELLAFDSEDVDPLLNELQARGFLLRYKNSDGSFIQISKFLAHQAPHYSEKPSFIKPPIPPESSVDDEAKKPEKSGDGGSIKRVSQPPDSLNPDSPNPDSPNQTCHQELRASTDLGDSTPAERVCARLKTLGITGANPTRPELLKLLADGVPESEILAVGEEEKSRGKGMAWVIAAVIGRRAEAAAQQSAGVTVVRKIESCCFPGCGGKVSGTVSGRPWCRDHREYAMDNANFRRAAA